MKYIIDIVLRNGVIQRGRFSARTYNHAVGILRDMDASSTAVTAYIGGNGKDECWMRDSNGLWRNGTRII